jgi:GGDEF domain-containing protein
MIIEETMLFKKRPREEPEEPSEARASARSGPAVLHDELGLYHLWYLELRLKQELARAARSESAFTLAAWKLRALPGAPPSDEYMRQAADFIVSSLRAYDIVARVDVDRIAAILFDAGYEVATTVAFRIKGDLQRRQPSAGRWLAAVAAFGRDGVDGDTLIQTIFRRLDADAGAA